MKSLDLNTSTEFHGNQYGSSNSYNRQGPLITPPELKERQVLKSTVMYVIFHRRMDYISCILKLKIKKIKITWSNSDSTIPHISLYPSKERSCSSTVL
jgi:hypothetical protein